MTTGWPRRTARTERGLAAAVLILLAGACADAAPTDQHRAGVTAAGTAIPAADVPIDTTPFVYAVDTIARGLEVPWGVAQLPDGRILVTERTGRIVAIDPATGRRVVWASLDVYAEEPGIGPEAGLMGIAVAPDFQTTREVYVVATTWRTRGDKQRALSTRLWRRLAGRVVPEAALRYRNQVLRFRDADGRGTGPDVLVEEIPTAFYHAGGAISVGPDGMLYVTNGDALLPERAGRQGATNARILRYTRDGRVPTDNPIAGDAEWARGLRNAQGLAWLSDTVLIAIEHGPTGMPHEGGRGGHDELNHIRRGADYGWPRAVGDEVAPGASAPLFTWAQPIAPAGVAVLRGAAAPRGHTILIAGLRGVLERVGLASRGPAWVVSSRQRLLDGQFGRLRAVAVDDQGRILLTTSNRDARGAPRPGDDLLVRLTPQAGSLPDDEP
jgi:glucose/arabinose dehydrogenase